MMILSGLTHLLNRYNRQKYGKSTLAIWLIFASGTFNIFVLALLIKFNFLWLFGSMPDYEALENPRTDQASEVYSADGVLLGKYYRENRSPVTIDQISPHMINALISTEDIRFRDHSGIDLKAFFAIFYYMAKGDNRGASTITQQLAKNLFKTRTHKEKGMLGYIPLLNTMIAKAKEWMLSLELESRYTKDEIITLYLNTVDFGNNAFGLNTAARTYFNTTPDNLSPAQAAMLAGMLKAPTTYSPTLNPQNCKSRRNTVLDLMVENQCLKAEEAEALKQTPLGIKFTVESHNDGMATYFRGTLNKTLTEWCKEHGKDLYGDGLKIYTTIDSRLQAHAEKAVGEHLKGMQKQFFDHWKGLNPWRDEKNKEIPNFLEDAARNTDTYLQLEKRFNKNQDSIKKYLNLPKRMKVFTWEGEKDTTFSTMDSLRYYKHFLHSGFMAMDPYTGQIKAWVGGINYKYFKYDHVKQSRRQPGSSFKPFVYTAAIAQGYNPCYLLPDRPVTLYYNENGQRKEWSPKNADWIFHGDSITLRRAMGRSINSIAARLIGMLGEEEVIKYAYRCGIKSKLDTVPSLALGSSEVTVYEMAGAYSTFVNNGIYTEPYFISRIEDHNGNVLEEFYPIEAKVKKKEEKKFRFYPEMSDALTEELAYVMLHMLKGGIQEPGGTSQALFAYNIFQDNEVGGKTGTTSDHSDGWYIGVTPGIVAATWVGADDPSVHFRTSLLGEGARTALPVFGKFMERILADKELKIRRGSFARPKKLTININCPYRPEPVQDSVIIEEVDPLLEEIKSTLPEAPINTESPGTIAE